jgi:hypothetical protein
MQKEQGTSYDGNKASMKEKGKKRNTKNKQTQSKENVNIKQDFQKIWPVKVEQQCAQPSLHQANC